MRACCWLPVLRDLGEGWAGVVGLVVVTWAVVVAG